MRGGKGAGGKVGKWAGGKQRECRYCRRIMRKRKAYLFFSMGCIRAYENRLGQNQWWNQTDKDRTLWRHTSLPYRHWLSGGLHANHGFQKMKVGPNV